MSDFRSDIVAIIPHLRASARVMTGGNSHFADDLVQDTIVNALQAEHQFTPGTNLKAWLFTILRNRFYTLVRRQKFTVSTDDDVLAQLHWAPAAQEGAIEAQAFKRAFNQLSPTHREVLVLTVIHGWPYEKVAEQCNCQVGTIKSRVNRARAQLKKMMLGSEDGEELTKFASSGKEGIRKSANAQMLIGDART